MNYKKELSNLMESQKVNGLSEAAVIINQMLTEKTWILFKWDIPTLKEVEDRILKKAFELDKSRINKYCTPKKRKT